MSDCIFCKIANGEMPTQKVYENEYVIAFRDLEPQAPSHILIIPKEHIESVNKIDESNSFVVAKIFEAAAIIAANEGYNDKGYRIVNNCGQDGGQTVMHLHFHLMGGRSFLWPAG